ncbi:MAG TPA: hypothetical protein PKA00_18135 [Saprospiraceae bacterium]|nr:hypothetical protein [Saprospiraceae bacterium]HMQ84838.1 hypothetical protein [Saprospiraceae bacterium]
MSNLDSASLIVQAAIEYAGGLSAWKAKKRLQFTKAYTLFLESGEIEKQVLETHDYQYAPLKITIESEEDHQSLITVLENGQYRRFKGDSLLHVGEEALEKAINSATYVVSVPFNLLDEGTVLAYEGIQKMPNGQMAEVVRVSYGQASSDVWRYYFHPESKRVMANSVVTDGHTSFVENLSFERIGGILFFKKRKSWRIDRAGNFQYLRAEYNYDNYQLQ